MADRAPQPASGQAAIQVFGTERHRDTRAAIRFFRERRTPISFVDLRRRPIAPGELRRFAERLGAAALLDPTSGPYREAGLAHLRMDEAGITQRLLADTDLIRLPLVRHGNDVTVGRAEATWSEWLRGGTSPVAS